jgi:hypothetical protein
MKTSSEPEIAVNLMTAEERRAWNDGYNCARLMLQKELDIRDDSLRRIMFLQDKEMRRWRDAGITYDAVRAALNSYESSEISFGKLVEELRGLAAAALEKLSSE